MRTALKMIGGKERHTFYGTFARYGIKSRYKGTIRTVLLVNVEDENHKKVTNHLWFNLTKGFKKLDMSPGDKVKFDGRVKQYVKGYLGNRLDVYAPIEVDYLICYPTKVSICKKQNK